VPDTPDCRVVGLLIIVLIIAFSFKVQVFLHSHESWKQILWLGVESSDQKHGIFLLKLLQLIYSSQYQDGQTGGNRSVKNNKYG